MAASKTDIVTTPDKVERTDIATQVNGEPKPEIENLPALLSRLGEDVMGLVDTKISLLKVELKEEAKDFSRSVMFMAFGGIIAAIGCALSNVAVAFGVSALFASANFSPQASLALGFLVTGAVYLLIGSIVVIAFKNRLTKRDPLPNRSFEELRKDKQWLKNEL